MKFLYVTCAVVEKVGNEYYNNALATSIPRYKQFAHELIVACYIKDVQIPTSEKVPMHGIQLVELKKINTLKGLFFDFSKNEHVLKSILPNVDGCICHVPAREAILTARIALSYKIPSLLVVIGCPWDAYWNLGIRGKCLAIVEYYKLRQVMNLSTHSIYVTDRFLQKRYPTRGKCIGCSDVSLMAFSENVLYNRIKRIQVLKTIKIGTLAAVDVPYKGQRKVIKALAMLANEGLDYEYHLAGNGDQSKLQEYAKKLGVFDKVIFHGGIPHERVTDFLDQIDIYIQPSDVEGLPRALVEAMSRACPAIGSNVGGIPELLPEDMLFQKKDIKGICKCLKMLTPERMLCDAKRNFYRSKDFDSDKLSQKRYDFINQFLEDYRLIR